MVRAISFALYVAVRLPPSRSSDPNVSPGLTLHSITSQSERIRVPPVTEAKSPPDSRITGADSPVMALSSTDAPPPENFTIRRQYRQLLPVRYRLYEVDRQELCPPQNRHIRLTHSASKTVFFTPFRLVGLRFTAAFCQRREISQQYRPSSTANGWRNSALPGIAPLAIAMPIQVVSRLPFEEDDKHHRIAPLRLRV